ncbi:MAG: N-hydroxyarylamine O-acetyltransferase [Planctomycetota bacterium]|jgi:N-hydroxyarylamine O-acetyltransferase
MDERRRPCSNEQLDRYLQRVAVTGPVAANEATLIALHQAHLRAIPFENLEIHLGQPMRIEPDALFEDLVDRQRGGYCFQMNELLALALLAIGFEVERFAARVWLRNPSPMPPRSHQVLRVRSSNDRHWLCDVGFGGGSPLMPLPFEMQRVEEQPLASYRMHHHEDYGVVLQMRGPEPNAEQWSDMISFSLEDQWPADFRYSNHSISTMPESRFVMHRIASRAEPKLRQSLFDGTYRETRPTGVTERLLDAAEEERVLRETFGLDLPTPLVWQSRGVKKIV